MSHPYWNRLGSSAFWPSPARYILVYKKCRQFMCQKKNYVSSCYSLMLYLMKVPQAENCTRTLACLFSQRELAWEGRKHITRCEKAVACLTLEEVLYNISTSGSDCIIKYQHNNCCRKVGDPFQQEKVRIGKKKNWYITIRNTSTEPPIPASINPTCSNWKRLIY